MDKVQTLKGFRDFLPQEARKRQYVTGTLKQVFESFGFEPLETPALEYQEILSGKYGDEGEKLMYKFIDHGDRNVALRYDQTVPLARVVAQYGETLPTPFRRYQIQNVWRAENTQKGRFREFIQCDIDTVGISSTLVDAELLAVVYESYKALGLDVVIKVNDRKLLQGIEAKYLASIDKFYKIGKEGVIAEMVEKGLSQVEAVEIFDRITNTTLQQADNLNEIISSFLKMGYPTDSVVFDSVLVRGLDYYTGLIMEVVLRKDQSSSSLGGGGRYDNLIGIFTNKQVPAAGFAIGFDRTMEAMADLNLFPQDLQTTKVLVTIFNPELQDKSSEISTLLRSNNIATELWLDSTSKLEKQLKYANKKDIPYVAIVGPDEVANNTVTLKDLKNNSQSTIQITELVEKLQK